MPQPDSNMAFFFSHDADMRNDIKIKALRREYGHTGYAVWCFILETLTASEDFEFAYNDLTRELLANDFDITPETLTKIVDLCCKIGLLSIEDNRLYCNALKRRFQALNEQRERRSEIGRMNISKRWNRQQQTTDSGAIALNNNGIVTDSNNNRIEDNRKEIKYPYQDILKLWNIICVSLPKVQKLTDDRRNKIRCRLNEFSDDSERWLPMTRELFERVQASDFLRGDNASEWVASFDWLFSNSKNWLKVTEGNYDNGRGTRKEQQNGTDRRNEAAAIVERMLAEDGAD